MAVCVAKPDLRADLCGTSHGLSSEGKGLIDTNLWADPVGDDEFCVFALTEAATSAWVGVCFSLTTGVEFLEFDFALISSSGTKKPI